MAADARRLANLAMLPRAGDSIRELLRRHGPTAAGNALPFLLVVYLALKGGGYSPIVRGEVGLAVWWIVLLGSLVGVLPTARLQPLAWGGLGLVVAFGVWTGLGIGWSESSERSVAELGRVATYAGVLTLVLSVQGRAGLQRTVRAIAAALGFIAVLALASRLHPSWFPADLTAEALPSTRARLNYPVNYWNGLAALIAIGIPLILCVAVESRRLATQAVATAALPVMALTAFYTLSRGGALELAVALTMFVLLYPRRLLLLPTMCLGAVGSVLLIAAATQRDALEGGLTSHSALAQGDEMTAIVLVVCAGVALMRTGWGLAERYGFVRMPHVSRRAATGVAVTAVATVIVVALVAGVPAELSDRWQEFKRPLNAEVEETAARFESASGNGRYQYWESAIDANATDPLIGIGPGTFEFWWAREGTIPGFVRDAHSLYFETLGELGIIGLVLILSLILGTVGLGVWRSIIGTLELRPWRAAATAACAAFATAAAVDWAWELPVLPITFLLLAAGILTARSRGRVRGANSETPRWPQRLALVGLALVGIAAIAIPLAGTSTVRASQHDVIGGDLHSALEQTQTAQEIQPYAASPSMQEALVLELTGNLEDAAIAARKATRDEPTNWRTWLVLSRIQAFRGEAAASIDAYRRARALNPRSPLFAR